MNIGLVTVSLEEDQEVAQEIEEEDIRKFFFICLLFLDDLDLITEEEVMWVEDLEADPITAEVAEEMMTEAENSSEKENASTVERRVTSRETAQAWIAQGQEVVTETEAVTDTEMTETEKEAVDSREESKREVHHHREATKREEAAQEDHQKPQSEDCVKLRVLMKLKVKE